MWYTKKVEIKQLVFEKLKKVIKWLDKNLNVWYNKNTELSWNNTEKSYKTTWQSEVNMI